MWRRLVCVMCLIPCLVAAEEKLAEDPTRVETKLGLSYDDAFNLSASFAFDAARKINASINKDASEWRLGGSWLFPVGIVNFSFGRNEFTSGAHQTHYSVGTFIPLSYFGFKPFGIEIFPAAGYSHNNGEIICRGNTQSSSFCHGLSNNLDIGLVTLPVKSNGGYLGMFALKPITPALTLILAAGSAKGSNHYSGHAFGAGLGLRINERQSCHFLAYSTDNSYGSESHLGLSYKYTF
ncbi:hypothetical protein [Gallaecimonas mangrovi]|uniref:hypothetical protein n=1 Tax=Gallaecimonas mangrovi TaxID=2291597 RepID=UPI00126026A4|nr:hypothetical protein [Gallaecimonas mangrovi]